MPRLLGRAIPADDKDVQTASTPCECTCKAEQDASDKEAPGTDHAGNNISVDLDINGVTADQSGEAP